MSTNKSKAQIETPLAHIELFSDPVDHVKVVLKPVKIDELLPLKIHIQQHNDFLKGFPPLPTVIDVRQLKGVNKTARNYAAKAEEAKEDMENVAAIIDSGLSKVIGNFFLRFSKPLVTTRLFTKEDQAREWVLAKSENTASK